MKNRFLNLWAFTAIIGVFALTTSCSDDDNTGGGTTDTTIRKTFENKIYSYFEWSSDLVYQDPHADYEIRVSKSAWRDILGWVEKVNPRKGVALKESHKKILHDAFDEATKEFRSSVGL